MKLAIIGTGYVGLVSGTGFANLGNDVTCLDIDRGKVETLAGGQLTIYEPGLEEIFQRNIRGGRLKFTDDVSLALRGAEIIFICVGTPSDANDEADLSAVDEAAAAIGRHIEDYTIIVNKSTVPVGTADRVRAIVGDHLSREVEFDVVSNPEFLREGAAVKDFENPDRIVIGTDSRRAEEKMTSLYRSLARTERPIMVTDIRSAELIKYASNAMLATRISFMNQLSHLCEKAGADIKDVARGLGLDSRIGSRFLHAGIGYGGSCFPKDVKALIGTLRKFGCQADLFEAVHRINEVQKTVVVDKLQGVIEIPGSTIALWGISFKPKTDDIREAPSLSIIERLTALGARIHAFDPVAMERARTIVPQSSFFDSPYEAIRDCDALVVVTEWDEFRNLDMRAVKVLLRRPIVVDGRNIYDPAEMRAMGFTYLAIGR
jgi:UDPglucose 6-dehydrogenase